MKNISSLLWLGLAGLTLSCSQSSRQPVISQSGDTRVVATVNAHFITVDDLQAEAERHVRGRLLSTLDARERDDLLERLVQRQSVYARALAEGFDQSPSMRRQVEELIVNRYLAQTHRDTAPEASESDIQRHYDEHREKFTAPAQVRFGLIKIGVFAKATEAKRAEALERAESILQQARASNSPETFDTLARLHSEDQSTRYRGGDVGWISQDEPDRWSEPVVTAAFALEQPGELSPVVSTRDAFYVIRLTERKSATLRPLSEVKAAIAYQLSVINRDHAEAQFFRELQSSQEIKINRALLESLSSSVQQTETKTPGTPAG